MMNGSIFINSINNVSESSTIFLQEVRLSCVVVSPWKRDDSYKINAIPKRGEWVWFYQRKASTEIVIYFAISKIDRA